MNVAGTMMWWRMMLLLSMALWVSTGCSPATPAGSGDAAAPADTPVDTPHPPDPYAWVYRCSDADRFVVRYSGDSARVEWDGGNRATLPHVVSASGARYSDGEITFWDKGGVARFEMPADTFVDCPSTPAAGPGEVSRLLGYEYRPMGDQPSP